MPVKTAKVQGRRKLDYSSFEELMADAEKVSSGPVDQLGNWTPGQIFKHLAIAFNGSIDGFEMKFPLPMRLLAKLFKKKLLSSPMPAGFNLPADGAKLLTPDPTSKEVGLTALREAITRLQRDPHRAKHPVFGDISKEEWDKIHLKHASLHMSFLVQKT